MSIDHDEDIEETEEMDVSDEPTLGEQLVDAVLDASYTHVDILSGGDQVIAGLSVLAEAFVDNDAAPNDRDRLADVFVNYAGLDRATAKDQSKHAFETMKRALDELAPR